MDKTCMVAMRKTVPITIKTKGPESERRGLSGGGAAGGTPGVKTGLDMVHLARRGRLLRIGRRRRRRDIGWNARGNIRRSARGQASNMSAQRSIALHQLDDSYHQQNGGPGSAKAHARNAVQQEKYAQSDEHCRAHELAGAAVFTLASRGCTADQAPVFGKEPNAEKDQDERPETI